jgi:CubicO group peptidase (beta-lactamase class C family)
MYERTMTNPVIDLEWPNQRQFREAGIPSAGGSGNARGLAKIYAALVSNAKPLLSDSVLKDATCQRIAGVDQGSGGIGRYAAGFRMNVGDMGANPAAFGHPGLGGTTGFADAKRELGVGYTSCRACLTKWQHPDSRLTRLLSAFYAADKALTS